MAHGGLQSLATRVTARERLTLTFHAAREACIHAALRDRLGGLSGSDTAMRLMANALEPSTYAGYQRLFEHFASYCEGEQVESIPASPFTVLSYIGHLAELGTWAESSLQPILSAINRVHRDLGLDPPALGSHYLTATRQAGQPEGLPGTTPSLGATTVSEGRGEHTATQQLPLLRPTSSPGLLSPSAGVHVRR